MTNSIKPKMNISRLAICAFIMSLLMAAMLYIYCNQIQDVIAELEADSNPMENFIWVVRNLANLLPVAILAVFQSVVYAEKEGQRGLYHREQRLECIIALIFTFLVMLPFVCAKSNSTLPEEEDAQTLFQMTYMWFATQMIPFIILIMYHGVRYRSELESDGKEEVVAL